MRYIRTLSNRDENFFGVGTKLSHLLPVAQVIEADDDDAEHWVRQGVAEYAETEADLASIGKDETSNEKSRLEGMKRAELVEELANAGRELSDVKGTGARGAVTNDDIRAFLLALDADDGSDS